MALEQGQTFSGDDVIGTPFTFANGGNLFVQTADTETVTGSGPQTIAAIAGIIDVDTITFGDGGPNYVRTGTASATATGDDAAAAACAYSEINGDQITFGIGGGNYVLASPTATATATGTSSADATAVATTSSINGDQISFGNGTGRFVELGAATATANATASAGIAIATAYANAGGAIFDDTIAFGNGGGDSVQIEPNVTVNVTADATNGTGTANVDVTVNAGDISSDHISFGDGGGDSVEVGKSTATINSSAAGTGAGDANNTVTLSEHGGGTITNDMITFGDGDGNFVQVADEADFAITGSATASLNQATGGNASLTYIVNFDAENAAINNDHVTFGNGNGDYVDLAGPNFSGSIRTNTLTGTTASGSPDVTGALGVGTMSGNVITFGNGDSNYVFAVANFDGNKIAFGNGNGDYVDVLDGPSSNNQIILGNGNTDSVSLPGGFGGDTIITGTGNSDTVLVGSHSTSDIFGFALGTGGTALSQTTVSGAQPNDQVAVGNSSGLVQDINGLGSSLVNAGTVAALNSVNDFINYLDLHGGLTKGDTYAAESAGNTFVVTDTQSGEVGGIELVGTFDLATSSITNHILTLA